MKVTTFIVVVGILWKIKGDMDYNTIVIVSGFKEKCFYSV